ncbi:MAG TPA: protein kinase [Gemmataceae bacterium]|nr:protein kinase [Gemmataceae bacterium]
MGSLTQTTALSGRLPTGELDLTGRTLADFHILRHLGQGGMGQVYLAEQISLKRKVALKILRPELAADSTALQRFKAEATAVAQATHANIVQIYAIGEADGIAYMALEYVEGRNLREYLLKKGPPELLLSLSIMRQVASALQRAAELGIIHRDIKPENILLTRKGEVKVADFGLSRCLAGDRPALNLTQSGVTMGTPLYMSPEQVEGKPVDSRTDIYSFGVTCYHMLAGHPPFQGESPFEVALQHVRDEPKPLNDIRPDLPAALCAIVHKMMAKDLGERYQTGRELLKDIARLREGLSGQTATAATPSPSVELVPASAAQVAEVASSANLAPATVPMPKWARQSWGWRGAVFAGSVLMAGVIGVAVAWLQHRLALPARAAVVPAPDEPATNRLETKEQALRTLLEPYFDARPGNFREVQKGVEQAMDLGMCYLEQDRLDDARALFVRLEKNALPAFRVLAHLGQGIVLALQNEPHESNKQFVKVHFEHQRGKQPKGLENLIRTDPKWRYWINKAIHYNLQNGLDRSDIPALFVNSSRG